MRRHPVRDGARRRDGSEAGFTLVEILTGLGIIVLLAAVALPHFGFTRTNAYNAHAASALNDLASAESRFYTIEGRYVACGSAADCSKKLPGLRLSDDLAVSASLGDAEDSFTARSRHANGDTVYRWDSANGGMQKAEGPKGDDGGSAGDSGSGDDGGAGDPGKGDDGGAGDPGSGDDGGAGDPGKGDDGGAGDPGKGDDGGAGDPGKGDDGGAADPVKLDPADGGASDPVKGDPGGKGDPVKDPVKAGDGGMEKPVKGKDPKAAKADKGKGPKADAGNGAKRNQGKV